MRTTFGSQPFLLRAAMLALALALAGCAAVLPRLGAAIDGADAECLAWYDRLDAEIEKAGVRDAEEARITGLPFLRINRLAAALAQRASGSDEAFDVWLTLLSRLDGQARRVEIANAGRAAVDGLGGLAEVQDRLSSCSARLNASLQRDPQARLSLIEQARVPDRYSTALRIAGLYALTRVPFFAGVQQWQRDHEQAMQDAALRPRPARRLAPAALQGAPAALFDRTWPMDALGLPQIDAVDAERLLAAHAPVFDIETEGGFDRIGTPRWTAGATIEIDTAQPVVYQRLTHTLVRGRALVQLVYTLWFPERPRRGAFDLLGGAIDGVIVRITLGPDGRPVLADTIHACGCYHLFFPGPGVSLRPAAPRDQEWAYTPAPLPAWAVGNRLALRIASATHYVIGISAVDGALGGDATYQRQPEAHLRRITAPDGRSRSLYGPDGLVAGSERGERFLFWPMGIASAGAMRQWGHHATAFVGRRHFDDADLIDRRFTSEAAP